MRRLLAGRRVLLNGELWLDDARRLQGGDVVQVLERPAPAPNLIDQIPLRHVDEHLVVVEKPPGIATVRHPAERGWKEERRLKVPTLDDLVLRQLGQIPGKQRLRVVQRLDKETSGLVVFARSVAAERAAYSRWIAWGYSAPPIPTIRM